jgi:hypothetical protein
MNGDSYFASAKTVVEYADKAVVDVVLRTYELREGLIRRNKTMTITRGLAATAMFAGLAMGTAGTAWAEADQTMSGHYIETETGASGRSTTNDWYFTPCGDGCASATRTPAGAALGQARLVNGQWTIDVTGETVICEDGTQVPNALSAHYTWDASTLAGTVQLTANVSECGAPAGHQKTNSVQLRQAP